MRRGQRQSHDDEEEDDGSPEPRGAIAQRVDKWLWHARVVKTRALAVDLVEAGRVRRNRERLSKAADLVRSGDVLTITLPTRVRVLKVKAHAERRGGPTEAALLYEDVTAKPPAGD